MARLMFSRRELRLVCEADSVVTRPLFPLRLEIIVVTALQWVKRILFTLFPPS